MKSLDKKDIFKKTETRKIEKVEIPEWDGFVFIRAMCAVERDEYEDSILVRGDGDTRVSLLNNRAKLLFFTMCDETGKRLFTTESEKLKLGEIDSCIADRLVKVAMRLSGLDQNEIEERKKNSEIPDGNDSLTP